MTFFPLLVMWKGVEGELQNVPSALAIKKKNIGSTSFLETRGTAPFLDEMIVFRPDDSGERSRNPGLYQANYETFTLKTISRQRSPPGGPETTTTSPTHGTRFENIIFFCSSNFSGVYSCVSRLWIHLISTCPYISTRVFFLVSHIFVSFLLWVGLLRTLLRKPTRKRF